MELLSCEPGKLSHSGTQLGQEEGSRPSEGSFKCNVIRCSEKQGGPVKDIWTTEDICALERKPPEWEWKESYLMETDTDCED